MTAYATRKDVYDFGLPRGTLGHSARLLASVLAATDILTLDGHGFEDDDQVLVRAADGGTLAAPLVANQPYYVKRVTDSTFQLALTAGGAAIDITSNGVEMLVSIALPFDKVLEFYSRWVDDILPAHAVPIAADDNDEYPIVVVATVAELAAKKLLHLAGHTSVSVNEFEAAAKKTIERYAAGLPLRDAKVDAQPRTNLAYSESTGCSSAADPRGWGSGALR